MGVQLDPTIKMTDHCAQVKQRAEYRLHHIRCICKSSYKPSSRNIELLVKALVMPVIQYGAAAYLPLLDRRSLDSLNSIIFSAARLIMDLPRK